MGRRVFLDPGDLTGTEKTAVLEAILEALWPKGREKEPWSPDTADKVVQVLSEYNLVPPEVG